MEVPDDIEQRDTRQEPHELFQERQQPYEQHFQENDACENLDDRFGITLRGDLHKQVHDQTEQRRTADIRPVQGLRNKPYQDLRLTQGLRPPIHNTMGNDGNMNNNNNNQSGNSPSSRNFTQSNSIENNK